MPLFPSENQAQGRENLWARLHAGGYALALAFAALIAMMLLVTLTGLGYMEATKQQLHDLVTERMAKLQLSTGMRIAARERIASLQHMTVITDPFERDEHWMRFNARGGRFAAARGRLLEMPLSDEERTLLTEQGRLTGIALPIQERVVELVHSGRLIEAQQVLAKEAIPAQDNVLERLAALQELQETAAAAALTEAERAYDAARLRMNALSIFVLVLAGFIAVVVVYRQESSNRALREVGKELKHQATHDALTGLLNRLAFDQCLEDSLAACRVTGTRHVLCYLDLDLFKGINDAVGHLAGDELLRQLAEHLRGAVRPSDRVGRLGGDEFAVLFVNCTLEDGLARAEELRRTIRDARFAWGTKSFEIGASIGVTPVEAHSGNLSDVLGAVDDACRQAKASGRNRLCIAARAEDREARRDDLAWVARLRQATDEGDLVLCAQPIKSLTRADSIPRFEVLLCLRGEDGETVAPGVYLPIAERYHLMPMIDRAVVRATLARLGAVRQRHPDTLCANINLSGQSLYDSDFLDFLLREIRASRVPPRWLCFEITETSAIANLSTALEFVRAVRELGCSLALDDFGSGLSSFGYLKSLRADFIKIDGVFVRDIDDDPIDRAMVKSLNDMAHVMGIRTIAEYVESDAIRRQLEAIEVDFAQGYALGRPEPLDALLTRVVPDPRLRAI